MDAESSSNMSEPRVHSKIEYPRGTDNEVLRIDSSTLWLMAGGSGSSSTSNQYDDDHQIVGVVRKGDFSFRMIVQTHSPILITICMMNNGDLQWPLTRDTPVLRVGSRSFAFAMPRLLYGLQFSCSSCCEEMLETLERVLMRFGHYEDHSGGETGIEFSIGEDDPNFWAASQLKIEKTVEPFLTRLGATNYKSLSCYDHYNTNEHILRMIRMSAITKMITKGVLVGGIDPNEHIELFGPINPLISDEHEDHDVIDSRASATIFVFSDIVEAVEAYGVIISGKYQSMPPYEPKWTPTPNITFWNISKSGLIRLLQVMVASATMNVEIMGDSTTRIIEEEIYIKVNVDDEPMDEDLNFVDDEEIDENAKSSILRDNDDDKEVIAPIREIKFSIINEVAGNINMDGSIEKGNQMEELREACATMEVA